MVRDGKLSISRESVDTFVCELVPEYGFELIALGVSPWADFHQLKPETDESQGDAFGFQRSQPGRGEMVIRPAVVTADKSLDQDRPLDGLVVPDEARPTRHPGSDAHPCLRT